MSSGSRAGAAAESEALSEAVQRILDSSIFQRARRLSQLLAYMAERTSEHDFDSLKEHVIGHRVFNRPAAYNPAEDNIVRSNVHQLRLKLAEYNAIAGSSELWRVTVPKGSYALALEPPAVSESRASDSTPPTLTAPWPFRRIVISSSVVVMAVAVVLAIYFFAKPARASKASVPNCLLHLLAPHPGQRLTVVTPDANVQTYQRLTGRTVSLQEYVNRGFLRPEELRRVLPSLASSAHVLFQESVTQSFVLDVVPRFARAVPSATLSVRNPDSIGMKDFEKDNAILISGPYGDPWVQLFDRDLNFQIETYEGNRRAHIVDRHPKGSERREYNNYADPSNTTVCYARVAYLPGLTAGTHVLLAGGPHVASTEAACLFLTRPEAVSAVRKRFHVKPSDRLPYFELLIEARALGNAPWQMSIVAGRTVPGK